MRVPVRHGSVEKCIREHFRLGHVLEVPIHVAAQIVPLRTFKFGMAYAAHGLCDKAWARNPTTPAQGEMHRLLEPTFSTCRFR